ncbi:MAG: hypothetical protein A3D96_03850 [Chlamydiae bacterium RIFCSPHIGHO2_12_FULL_44_59]|nr:MAG: hypothetical protein A2796_02535 [Chlamydiae bacterium RIFCSPHIGHO2_01_FULL_44_39]OGN58716.1 MAG: hypothetical protein A3C42_05615 [Chlamydiae bacterium RIFCSPHIGHO2_02_FULL_45_9]OGN59895.1 MAG: hypothetical protein A3D96_03850 [Chlamydiae bacterium RIFCSPHIGHO2_12_FULL_44_59]OGN66102.1 MAG: hypothetical protein A2978_04365 [Chlamydiae bacterium RIFCSPLOWO2_01_FULL_44_52]OGN68637.1 MAG: hypothetical protein A3I67_02690 [Chlamydiae bacterium RIFCSPLOWO2_02_FULL_45_22]OGN69750.1 MAG: hyp
MLIFKKRLWKDRFATIQTYYKSPKFAFLDLTYWVIYCFSNPYRVSRKFLQKRGEKEIYAYGETPYVTYHKMACEVGLKETDVWMEMGSGRGKGCFWVAHFMKCRVIGVEWIPQFVYLSKVIRTLFRMKKVSFRGEEIQTTSLEGVTVIYLYGLWPPLQLSPKVKLITISEPIEGFRVVHSFWVRFPWGRTRAYVQQSF